MDKARLYSIAMVACGAILFGASAPLSKVLLGDVDPILMAGLLYLGCGAGLLLVKAASRFIGIEGGPPLARKDAPWLAGAVLAGGVAAPILLMLGLRGTPAATASLLLNFEAVSTTLIAAFVFSEFVGRRIWLAIACITAASAILSFAGAGFGLSLGALLILLACTMWGVDNNLTRYISAKDPLAIGIVKGLVAGAFSLLLALFLGAGLPGIGALAGALLLGAFSYGFSIALFIVAMRGIGAARASAWFALAPFAGVLISFLAFRDMPGFAFWIALPAMALGALLLFGDDHAHSHVHLHGTMVHEHIHSHDVAGHEHEH